MFDDIWTKVVAGLVLAVIVSLWSGFGPWAWRSLMVWLADQQRAAEEARIAEDRARKRRRGR